jgi:hypothetical protein
MRKTQPPMLGVLPERFVAIKQFTEGFFKPRKNYRRNCPIDIHVLGASFEIGKVLYLFPGVEISCVGYILAHHAVYFYEPYFVYIQLKHYIIIYTSKH